MKATFASCFFVIFVNHALGESPEPPVSETRLPVGIIIREDFFSGWLSDDMERHNRAMNNIELLLKQRPGAKSELLTWKGAGKIYRAVLAHEANKSEEFQRYYQEALDLFAEAGKLAPEKSGAPAVLGGVYVVFADRLPEEYRKASWSVAYDNFKILWGQQGKFVDKLPVHLRGELLGGLAQSAQRTGHDEELAQYLDKIIELLPGTPYERVAKRWKDNPKRAATGNISCKTCHADGRLAARLAKLAPRDIKKN